MTTTQQAEVVPQHQEGVERRRAGSREIEDRSLEDAAYAAGLADLSRPLGDVEGNDFEPLFLKGETDTSCALRCPMGEVLPDRTRHVSSARPEECRAPG